MASEIITEGSGWYEQMADRAELAVGYAGTGRDRASAVAALGTQVSAAEAAFGMRGVTVLHRRLFVHDQWRGNRVVGCRASEDVALRLDDVGALEAVLAALVATEPATLHGPTWLLTDPAAARRAAQERAVADARDRAEGYAAALGGTLGPLRRLSEGSDHGGARDVRMMAARAEAAPDVRELGLEPEPVRVTVHCTATWELLDTEPPPGLGSRYPVRRPTRFSGRNRA
jgi:uncharacterized protein YggE